MFVIRPLYTTIKAQEGELERYSTLINTLTDNIKTHQNKLSDLQMNGSTYLAAIPKTPTQEAIIRDLETLSSRHNYTFTALSFSDTEDKNGDYKVLKTSLVLEGSRSGLIPLLRDIENSSRFYRMEGISVGNKKGTNSGNIQLAITLEALYQG